MQHYHLSPEFREKINAAEQVVLALEANVDLDALASVLVISSLLDILNVRNVIITTLQPPKKYQGLPGIEKVQVGLTWEELQSQLNAPEWIIVSDIGDLHQLGDLCVQQSQLFASTPIMQIDHHIENDVPASFSFIDAKAAAVCEMVGYILEDLSIPMTADMSTLLLAGIYADTLSFTSPAVTTRTLNMAASLAAKGADILLASHISGGYSIKQWRLWGELLENAEIRHDGHIIVATVSQEILRRYDMQSSEVSGLANLSAEIENVKGFALLREQENGDIRVSFRSPGILPVVQVAEFFGGGGHIYAAACTIKQVSLVNARKAILRQFEVIYK